MIPHCTVCHKVMDRVINTDYLEVQECVVCKVLNISVLHIDKAIAKYGRDFLDKVIDHQMERQRMRGAHEKHKEKHKESA